MMAERVELPITGMTCASCANRIERRLNKLEGVRRRSTTPPRRRRVEYDRPPSAPEQLVAAVEAAGYSAALPRPSRAPSERRTRRAPLRRRLIVSAVLSLPVLLLSMIPALQFDNWQWLALSSRRPVVAVGRVAVPPRRVGEPQARDGDDGHADRLGVLAAWLWSLYALFLGDAGMPGMRMELRPDPAGPAAATQIYLEVGAVVTTFILAGRYFEARAKRRAGAALQALLELGAKDVAVLGADGAERRVPDRAARGRRPLRRAARARRSPPTASSRRAARRSTSRC